MEELKSKPVNPEESKVVIEDKKEEVVEEDKPFSFDDYVRDLCKTDSSQLKVV